MSAKILFYKQHLSMISLGLELVNKMFVFLKVSSKMYIEWEGNLILTWRKCHIGENDR